MRAAGIREMNVIKDHPEFWVVEILDGFGAHFSSPKALKTYFDHKIMQLKEEGCMTKILPRRTRWCCTAETTCCAQRPRCPRA